jgi:O-glycosyl hydrolase
VITQQPSDASYFTGETVAALTVNATVSDGGDISYQWYSSTTTSNSSSTTGWTSVGTTSGGNTKSFTPPSTAGIVYYYALVTNTNNIMTYTTSTAASRVVIINVTEPTVATANATITVNTTDKKQYVRGFGGMDVPWLNFPEQHAADTELMYSPDGLGLNIMRIMIMPPGWNDGNYTSHDVMVDNLLNNGRPDYINNVKIVNKYGGYVLASPWSPPKEWKSNNSVNCIVEDGEEAGELLREHWQDYADYLKAFCQLMYSRGAPIYAVSIQNEPNYASFYDGCWWEPEQMRDFFKQVGQFTQGVKGWGGGREISRVLVMNGESSNIPSINFSALADSVSRAAIDLYGRHIYDDKTDTLWESPYADYHENSAYQTECWMTEHNINSGNPEQPQLFYADSTWNYVWRFMNDVDLTIRLNNENAFIWWASKRFYSFIGDGQFGTYDGEFLSRGYGLSHYAKFAKETWQVGVTYTGTNANGDNLSATNFNQSSFNLDNTQVRATAYVSPDGNTISMVLFTPTDTSGNSGIDMGNVKIQLPTGFVAKSGMAMRSDSTGKRAQMESVALSADRNSAVVSLPASTILSVRFTR